MKKLIEKLFSISSCERCGSWSLKKGHFTSGWNHLCNQASGHDGVICESCLHVKFDESLEVRKSKAPSWVETKR